MKKLIKKVKNIIFKKNNINEIGALKEEEKNEELIEKIVHDHKGVYNWPDEDLKLIEKLVNPLIPYDKEDTERPLCPVLYRIVMLIPVWENRLQ